MLKQTVSPMVVRRLPRYYRYLGDLLSKGTARISSGELGRVMSITASQIRQDLNCFGGFGQQGYGYNVEALYKAVGEVLGVDKPQKTVIVGAGNLGKALANYQGFEKRRFILSGIFDVDKDVIGKKIHGITVMDAADIEAECKKIKPDVAILTLPAKAAPEMAQRLCSIGIKGIWNFSNAELKVTGGTALENVHLSDSTMALSYMVNTV